MHVDADAIGAASHAVDRQVEELFDAGDAAVVGDVADVQIPAADDVELLMVGREGEAVGRPRQEIGRDRDGHAAVRRNAIDVRRAARAARRLTRLL